MSEEPSKLTDSSRHSMVPKFLTGALVILGVPISIFGVMSSRLIVLSPQSTSNQVPPAVSLPADQQVRQVFLKRGDQLQKEQCSGCHDRTQTLAGPSFNEIVQSIASKHPYPEGIDRPESAALDPLPALAVAIDHPENGFNSYSRGPRLDLTANDKLALAYWILHAKESTGTFPLSQSPTKVTP